MGKDKFGFKGGWESTVSETGRTNGIVESIFRLSSVWRLVGYVQGALPTLVTRPVSDRTVPLSATPHAKLWLRWISFQWRLFYSASAFCLGYGRKVVLIQPPRSSLVVLVLLVYNNVYKVFCLTTTKVNTQFTGSSRNCQPNAEQVPCFSTSHSNFQHMECKEVWSERGWSCKKCKIPDFPYDRPKCIFGLFSLRWSNGKAVEFYWRGLNYTVYMDNTYFCTACLCRVQKFKIGMTGIKCDRRSKRFQWKFVLYRGTAPKIEPTSRRF